MSFASGILSCLPGQFGAGDLCGMWQGQQVLASAADGCGLLFKEVYFSRLWSAVSDALVLFLQAYLESQEGGQNPSREDKLQISMPLSMRCMFISYKGDTNCPAG